MFLFDLAPALPRTALSAQSETSAPYLFTDDTLYGKYEKQLRKCFQNGLLGRDLDCYSLSYSRDSLNELVSVVGKITHLHRPLREDRPLLDGLAFNMLMAIFKAYGVVEVIEPKATAFGKKLRMAPEDFLSRIGQSENWLQKEKGREGPVRIWRVDLRRSGSVKAVDRLTFGAQDAFSSSPKVESFWVNRFESSFRIRDLFEDVQEVLQDLGRRVELAKIYGQTPPSRGVDLSIQTAILQLLEPLNLTDYELSKLNLKAGTYPYRSDLIELSARSDDAIVSLARCINCGSIEWISMDRGEKDPEKPLIFRRQQKAFQRLNAERLEPWHRSICSTGVPEVEGYYSLGYRGPIWNGEKHSYTIDPTKR